MLGFSSVQPKKMIFVFLLSELNELQGVFYL